MICGPIITKIGTGVHLVTLFTPAGNDVTSCFRLAEIAFRKMTYIASIMRMRAYKPYIRDYRLADSTAVPAPVYLISAIIVSTIELRRAVCSPPGGELLYILLLSLLSEIVFCLDSLLLCLKCCYCLSSPHCLHCFTL